jgi:hypothetical protein
LFALAGCKWPGPIWIPSNLNLDRKREAQKGLLHRPGAPKEFVQAAGLNLRRHFRLAPRSELQGSLGVAVCVCWLAAVVYRGEFWASASRFRPRFCYLAFTFAALLRRRFRPRYRCVLRLGSRDSLGSEISIGLSNMEDDEFSELQLPESRVLIIITGMRLFRCYSAMREEWKTSLAMQSVADMYSHRCCGLGSCTLSPTTTDKS